MVQLLLGLSAFVLVPTASLPEAACTSCTRAGTNAGSRTDSGSFKFKITLSRALSEVLSEGLVGIGGGVRPLVALEPLGDLGAGVDWVSLLLDRETRD